MINFDYLRVFPADSTDPESGLQPAINSFWGWGYDHAAPVKPAQANGPFVETRSRDLTTERFGNDAPHCTRCEAELDPKWCDPAARAAVGDR